MRKIILSILSLLLLFCLCGCTMAELDAMLGLSLPESSQKTSFVLYRVTIDWGDYEETEDFDAPTEIEVSSTEKIKPLLKELTEEITYPDFELAGWYTDEDFSSKLSATAKPTGDMTVYAKWQSTLPQSHTLYLDWGEAQEDEDFSATMEVEGVNTDKIKSLLTENCTDVSWGDFVIDGWYYDEDLTEKVSSTDKLSRDTMVYVKWKDGKTVVGTDTTDYTTMTDGSGNYLYAGTPFKKATFSNYYHNYQSALSFTFDDGYDTESAQYVSDVFQQYGGKIRGTEMMTVDFVSSKVDTWKNILKDNMLDVGAHGYSHVAPVDIHDASTAIKETKTTREYLLEKFPDQKVLVSATPMANSNASDIYLKYLKENYLASREGASGVQATCTGEDCDFYNMKAVVLTASISSNDPTGANTVSTFGALFKKNAWAIALCHRVQDNPSGVDVSKPFFEGLVAGLLNKYGDTVWFGSFNDVACYQKQKEATSLVYLSQNSDGASFRLATTLDKDVYNIPMTVKFYVPYFVSSLCYEIDGGETIAISSMESDGADRYCRLYDVPVDSTVTVHYGGNINCNNGCTHDYQINDTVEATTEHIGYMEMKCSNCNYTWKTFYTPKVSQ